MRLEFYPTSDPSIRYVTASKTSEYGPALKQYVKDLLAPVVPEDHLELFVQGNRLRLWAQAFTHETFDANANGELFEFRGDRMLYYLFSKLIAATFPGLSHSEYSQLYMVYASHADQEKVARDLGMHHYIRAATLDATSNLVVDTSEAFIGVLDEICEQIEPGSGPVIAYELLKLWYGDLSTRSWEAYGAAKSQVQQFFPAAQSKKPEKPKFCRTDEGSQQQFLPESTADEVEYTFQTPGGISETVIEVLISPEKQRYLATLGFDLSGLPLYSKRKDGTRLAGRAQGRAKKSVSFHAYFQALQNLERVAGLTTPEFKRRKKEKIVWDIGGEPVYQKLQRLGLTHAVFVAPNKTNVAISRVIQLIADDANGKKVILGTVLVAGSKDNTKDKERVAYKLLLDQFMQQ